VAQGMPCEGVREMPCDVQTQLLAAAGCFWLSNWSVLFISLESRYYV
jgi:hypothetical protein